MSELATGAVLNECAVDAARKLNEVQADSWLLQAEMIRHGLPSIRFPKNALLSAYDGTQSRLAFIDGESYGSTFAGESFAQRGHSWRALLVRNRIPVPPSRSFRISSLNSIERYAMFLGFPVRLQEARDDRFGGSYSTVSDSGELARELAFIRGKKRGGRVLVQKHHHGTVLSVLVAGGEVLSVLDVTAGREAGEVGHTVHPELRALAVDAVMAVPGLEDGSVELGVEGISSPLQGQYAVIESISARPNLRSREVVSAAASSEGPAARLLQKYAARAGVTLFPPVAKTHLSLRFAGLTDSDTFVIALEGIAQDFDVRIVSRPQIKDEESVEASVVGAPHALALLLIIVVIGLPNGDRAHLVEATSANS